MELMDAIYHRRSVREYTDRPVPRVRVMELIQAAIQAPSAVNQQPWAFAVIRGRARLAEYSERARAHMLATLPQTLALHQRSDALTDPAFNAFHQAGTVVVIYAKPARYNPAEDCCLAAQNLMLAAHGLGLGTCPVGFVRAWLDLLEVKLELGVPPNYHAVLPIAVGWPAHKPPPVPRHEPEIACWIEGPDEAPAASAEPAPR